MTTDAGARRRVLIAAYACGPSDTPEASAGWAFAVAAAQRYDVWVITRTIWLPSIGAALDADPDLARHIRVAGIDLPQRLLDRRRRPWDLYWYYVLWQAKLARTAQGLHERVVFDVVHHVTFANDWLPSGAAALHGVPLVWGPVGGATRIPVRRLRHWLGRRGVVYEAVRATLTTLPRRVWGDANARRAAVVVAQNEDVAHRFRRAGGVVVEPNAALDTAVLPRRATTPAVGTARHAVFVGRLIPLKGVSIALEALSRREASDWDLTIYGDGPLRRELEARAAALDISHRVRFAGHVPREQALQAMADADALLFPSMHDQAGWAVAEASSMGTPVVCLPLGGPPVLAAPNHLVASLEGDLVGNVAAQLRRAATTPGVRHDRWSRDRLPAMVDGWYRRAIASRAPMGARTPSELRVLESVHAIKPTTNPYLVQLVTALRREPGVAVRTFDYWHAILGRYDLLHLHWPELLVGGHRRVGRLARRALAALLLARLSMTRTPVVRTWHNIERPEGLSRWDHAILDGFDRRTAVVIRLNGTTIVPLSVPVHTVAHGHYRDWYSGAEDVAAHPRRVAYLGLVRRYKGVEHLVRAFRDCRLPGIALEIAGKPSTPELAEALAELAASDPRVVLHPRFLDDDEFATTIRRSSLVVLPYRHMHNSGTALAALSLDRPVLVPDNLANRALAEEVGPRWVHTFQGELSGDDIDGALTALEEHPPTAPPALESRDWVIGAAQHIAAFREALRRHEPGTSAQEGNALLRSTSAPAPLLNGAV